MQLAMCEVVRPSEEQLREELLRAGGEVDAVTDELGVSRETIETWISVYDLEGLAYV